MAGTAINVMTFGVEIEVKCRLNQIALAQHVATVAGVECSADTSQHGLRSFWKVVRDGSVNGGWEIVSPPLKGVAGRAAVERVMKAVKMVASADSECGLHVHVSVPDMSLEFMRNMAAVWVKWESVTDTFLTANRRGNAAYYCKSNVFGTVNEMIARINKAPSIDALSRLVNPNGNRYFKFNMQSFWRHGTVEFRGHHGTVEATETLAWLDMLAEMVSTAMKVKKVCPNKLGLGADATRAAFLSRRTAKVAKALTTAWENNGRAC